MMLFEDVHVEAGDHAVAQGTVLSVGCGRAHRTRSPDARRAYRTVRNFGERFSLAHDFEPW
jgi:hypothetical protein